MDAKINGEWEKMERQQQVAADGEAGLKEEMKSESILRQVTYTAVLMVADFLDPTKPSKIRCLKFPQTDANNSPDGPIEKGDGTVDSDQAKNYPSLRRFCLIHREIVEPLLVFCTHGIRMRDTRCCSMILRLFVSLVPEFHLVDGKLPESVVQSPMEAHLASDKFPIPSSISSAIREYISLDVLKGCITSFHEPYFVELQKDLAALIAAIVVYYSPITSSPRDVLLSLPNVSMSDLERLSTYMPKPGAHTRQQRALVLDLLKDLKAVSVSEMGKLPKSSGFGESRGKRSNRSKMAQGFMSAPQADQNSTRAGMNVARQATPDGLDGVSNLFEG